MKNFSKLNRDYFNFDFDFNWVVIEKIWDYFT